MVTFPFGPFDVATPALWQARKGAFILSVGARRKLGVSVSLFRVAVFLSCSHTDGVSALCSCQKRGYAWARALHVMFISVCTKINCKYLRVTDFIC